MNSLFEFKTGHKAVETTRSINSAFNPRTAKKPTMQQWFKKFYRRHKSFENEESIGRSSEVDNNQLRGSLKLILLQLHGKLTMNSTSTILQLFIIWSKLERWKSSISGCFMSWQQIKKKIVLMCHFLLFYATKTNNFSIGLSCVMKSGFYSTIGDNQLSVWTEKKLQSTYQI